MNTYKKKIKLAVIAPPFSGQIYTILELILQLLNKKIKLSDFIIISESFLYFI